MLFIPLIGTIMFLTPIKTEDIPLIRKTRENWLTNFFSSTYIIILKTCYQLICIIHIDPMI